MRLAGEGDDWTARIVRDEAFRDAELRKSAILERVGGTIATVVAFIAVWGHTTGEQTVGGISAAAIGGIATLCFAAMMAITASGGIRRRVILLTKAILNGGRKA